MGNTLRIGFGACHEPLGLRREAKRHAAFEDACRPFQSGVASRDEEKEEEKEKD